MIESAGWRDRFTVWTPLVEDAARLAEAESEVDLRRGDDRPLAQLVETIVTTPMPGSERRSR